MHELGVVFKVADSVTKVAQQHGAERIGRVTLEIGEVSTVVPEYLLDVWKWNCKRMPMLEDCELIIERIHAATRCEDCQKTYDTVPQGITCPYCGSENTVLVTGNEFTIKEIAVI